MLPRHADDIADFSRRMLLRYRYIFATPCRFSLILYIMLLFIFAAATLR